MTKVPVDEAPAGPEMDATVAEASGYFRVPFETAKRNPPEIRDLPATEPIWVFTIDYECKINPTPWVYVRHFGAGDFDLWSPSTDIAAAWKMEGTLDVDQQSDYVMALFNLVAADLGAPDFYTFNRGVYWRIAHAGPLDRCRAFLKARGVAHVEVPDGI